MNAYDYPILGVLWSLAILLVSLLVLTAVVIWSWRTVRSAFTRKRS